MLRFASRKVEIMLVEGISSGSKPLNHNFDSRVRHEVYPTEMNVFNKCKLYNYAVSLLDSNVLIAFHDSDLLIDLDALEGSVQLIEEKRAKVSQPYSDQSFLEQNKDCGLLTGRPQLPICGGITVMSKYFLQYIGGWLEDFEGHGGEDSTMDYIISRFKFKTLRLDGNCLHLWHPIISRDINENVNNEQILRKVFEFNNEDLVAFVKDTRKKYKEKYGY